MVIYLGNEYETRRGYSTGVVIEPPSLGGVALTARGAWYYVLLAVALASLLLGLNLLRADDRRARGARSRAARRSPKRSASTSRPTSCSAFAVSSTMTAVAGALFAVLPRLRLGRGVLALPHHPVRRDGDHRRHGLDARAPCSARCS